MTANKQMVPRKNLLCYRPSLETKLAIISRGRQLVPAMSIIAKILRGNHSDIISE